MNLELISGQGIHNRASVSLRDDSPIQKRDNTVIRFSAKQSTAGLE
jgi:hypothetical protein